MKENKEELDCKQRNDKDAEKDRNKLMNEEGSSKDRKNQRQRKRRKQKK